MATLLKLTRYFFLLLLVGLLCAGLLVGVAYWKIIPELPSADSLRDVRLQVPLRIYTRDERLVAEYGEKRRTPVNYEDVPEALVKAFLAAEDDRFFEHPGVDYQGLLRAAVQLALTGEKRQGGSTITMQVARNFFLSNEKTYLRKIREIFLSLKIENELSKQDILELYLNKIYLGQRAYGVRAAAKVYYGLELDQLSLAQMAMIAGLPKAPSRYNPVNDPQRALLRRDYILGRMLKLGYIQRADYEAAVAEPDLAQVHGVSLEVEAPYVAEMVRADLLKRYGEEAYTAGYQVITTLQGERQKAANRAVRTGLLDYDSRHGYRGAEAQVDLQSLPDFTQRQARVNAMGVVGGLLGALVEETGEQTARLRLGDGSTVELDWEGMAWARPYVSANRLGPVPRTSADILRPGDLVRLESLPGGKWRLAQIPAAQAALVSLDPDTGAIVALVGGFDFQYSKFNRVTQANRQPGSNFKPFIYSAALEHGFTAASVINDAPVVFDDPALERTWRPENYSGHFYGPTRLRVALMKSRNLVSVRLLRSIGVQNAIDHAQRFGIHPRQMPRDLSLALGSGATTPLDLATGYAVFANGGYKIEPHVIERILDAQGQVIYRANAPRVCPECPPVVDETVTAGQIDGQAAETLAAEALPDDAKPADADRHVPPVAVPELPPVPAPAVISPQNAYLMNSLMRDVITGGTGRRALSLGRKDLAGKTGTTNDQQDAWFSGFQRHLVTTTWLGFDQLQPLGSRETGGQAALPIWIDYMREALAGVPEAVLPEPPGMVQVLIDPVTGLLAGGGQQDAIFEIFREDQAPQQSSDAAGAISPGGDAYVDPLF